MKLSKLKMFFAAVAATWKPSASRMAGICGIRKPRPADDIFAQILSMKTYQPTGKAKRALQTAEDREQRQSRARIKRGIRQQRNRWDYDECIQNCHFTRNNRNEIRQTA